MYGLIRNSITPNHDITNRGGVSDMYVEQESGLGSPWEWPFAQPRSAQDSGGDQIMRKIENDGLGVKMTWSHRKHRFGSVFHKLDLI